MRYFWRYRSAKSEKPNFFDPALGLAFGEGAVSQLLSF
jgi:hypothetical protein